MGWLLPLFTIYCSFVWLYVSIELSTLAWNKYGSSPRSLPFLYYCLCIFILYLESQCFQINRELAARITVCYPDCHWFPNLAPRHCSKLPSITQYNLIPSITQYNFILLQSGFVLSVLYFSVYLAGHSIPNAQLCTTPLHILYLSFCSNVFYSKPLSWSLQLFYHIPTVLTACGLIIIVVSSSASSSFAWVSGVCIGARHLVAMDNFLLCFAIRCCTSWFAEPAQHQV